jgi:hypothetical protein
MPEHEPLQHSLTTWPRPSNTARQTITTMRPWNTVNVAAVMLLLSVGQSTITNTRQSAMSNNTNSTPKAPKYLNKGAQAVDPNPIHPRAQPPSTDANSKIEARHSRMVDHLFQDWQRLLSDINMMIPQRCNAFQPARVKPQSPLSFQPRANFSIPQSMWSKLEQDFKNDVTWETKMLTAKEVRLYTLPLQTLS